MKRVWALMALTVAGFTATPALAQDGPWRVTIAPYLFASGLSGQQQIGNIRTNIDLSFGDVLDHLDWAAMGYVNVQNDKWVFNADFYQGKLSNFVEAGPAGVPVQLTLGTGIYAPTVGYHVHDNAVIYAGARIWRVRATVALPRQFDAREVTWADPVVGFRMRAPINRKLEFAFSGDFGGFGAAADYDVMAWPMLGYNIGNGWRAELGYKLNYVDYSTNKTNRFYEFDMLLHGPTLGVSYTF